MPAVRYLVFFFLFACFGVAASHAADVIYMKDGEVVEGTIVEEAPPPQSYLIVETSSGKRKISESEIEDILYEQDMARASSLLRPLLEDEGIRGLPSRYRWKVTGEKYAVASYGERSIWLAFGALVAGAANYLALYKRDDPWDFSEEKEESSGKRDVKVALAAGATIAVCPLIAYSFPAKPGLAARRIISDEGEEAQALFSSGYRREYGVKRAKHAAVGALFSSLVAVIYVATE